MEAVVGRRGEEAVCDLQSALKAGSQLCPSPIRLSLVVAGNAPCWNHHWFKETLFPIR